MNIKNEKLQFTINVEIACTESESFPTQSSFKNHDAAAMNSYLKEKIKKALEGSSNYAARVVNVTIKKWNENKG